MIPISKDRILILDGAMGTVIQRYGLKEDDYRTGPFKNCQKELRGNNECLNLTRPDIIKSIHLEYLEAGADIIETNTFSANRISQTEYGCEDMAATMAYEGARLAREAADCYMEDTGRKIWVAGSIGPTSKSLSLSPDASDPAFRPYGFDHMREAYREQAEALLKGGADLLLIETCFDALNVKAALAGIQDIVRERLVTTPAPSQPGWAPSPSRGWQNAGSIIQPLPDGTKIPVMISVSVGDKSGRTLTGQTLEAFYTSIRHYPIISFGLNCSLGAEELMPLVEDMDKWCRCSISCYPNAGLPNEMGGYDQGPEEMAAAVKVMADKGLLNIAGGCCGTTPEHIKAIAASLKESAPRPSAGQEGYGTCGPSLTVSGLEAVTIDTRKNNFTNIGERTNVAGSRKFARLISEGKYDEALDIAARQIEDGAAVIDINMDDAMLDSAMEMERFVRYVSNDPSVSKAALMIDSSHWDTILAGLKNAQGKCIVNSISLKDGPDEFIRKARVIKSLGASMVVMAFDEEGQATTFDRKTEICSRAYRLLTKEAEISPEDIIFDVNILSIGTGIAEHSRYAIDFIDAVRWIKSNLPGALTSGGVSNLSFAFRGNNAVREAMHSAFLYHAVKAGLDMAIVNPSMLQVYDEIDPALLKCVEDVIFDVDGQAAERLLEKAAEMLAAKDSYKDSGACRCSETDIPVSERLKDAIIKGRSDRLEQDLDEAVKEYRKAVDIIEGPLMEGMEMVGRMFGDGKMFLPQVVKSAKIMRDAVEVLQPYMDSSDRSAEQNQSSRSRPVVVIATVKGDVHDIGKNITGIVLSCNGFDIHDLGVMVSKETILSEAEKLNADIIAVSGLITPSLFQMDGICRAMAEKNMSTPLFIGGATTSAVHTAVRLAPIYSHVFYGPDASAAAVMAKKYMMDPMAFEKEEHMKQEKLRIIYEKETEKRENPDMRQKDYAPESYLSCSPEDFPIQDIPASEILPFFDWKMFYAIWGVRYGSNSLEAMELIQLRRDAEDEIAVGNFRIRLGVKFFPAYSSGDDIMLKTEDGRFKIPMLREESGKGRSLSDFIISKESGKTSPFGCFAISVTAADAHEEGCCCPACSNKYEDLIGKAVRMTLAEAASAWLDRKIMEDAAVQGNCKGDRVKVIKPAAGYSSCPDHTLKRDILDLLHGSDYNEHHHKDSDCKCGCCNHDDLGIRLTESYAMTPEASICGMIFIHPEASYPEIRRISRSQYEEYAERRGMTTEDAQRFLGHLLK